MKNQKGFSVVVLLLSILVVTAVGFTAYYVWNTQTNKKEEKAEVVSSTETEKAKPTEAITPTKEEQKYLVIKEWGVVLVGIEPTMIDYELHSQNTVKLTVPTEKNVSPDCKYLGIGFERAMNRNDLPPINEDSIVYVDGYYYSVGGSPGACNDNPDSYDYKTNWSAIDYMSNKLKSYKIEKAN